MIVSCVQMDMAFARPDENFARAEELIRLAARNRPDVVVLPETWNTGFFPRENLYEVSDCNGERTKRQIGALAAELSVNIVAGSVANRRGDRVFNTSLVFDRNGKVVASYDKTHLFSPMGEDRCFAAGDHGTRFFLDGIPCGLIICYDIRFPELTRSLTLQGVDLMFVVAQWPRVRIRHLDVLARARAIENQMFLVCCNSCGRAEETVYGGNSCILDPLGSCLASAGEGEEIISADCDFSVLHGVRSSISVFADRRSDLYHI